MARFEIARDEERLTLTRVTEPRIWTAGCPLFALSVVSVMCLGFLSVLLEAYHTSEHVAGEPTGFFSLSSNHFGLLWLICLVFMVVLIPFYVHRLTRGGTSFVFDRDAGRLLRNGKLVTPLRRIEYLRLDRAADTDGNALYCLYVVYLDGHELLIDDSYDEPETYALAEEIGRFIGVRLVRRL